MYNVIRNPTKLDAVRRPGRPRSFSNQQHRALLRKAREGHSSASQLRTSMNLNIGTSRIRQLLRSDHYLAYRSMTRVLRMTASHKAKRVIFAKQHLQWGRDMWEKVIWSDEKRFTLDGPDGWVRYWHDRGRPRRQFQRRQQGGGGVMVWAAFSGAGLFTLAFVETRMNSSVYCDTLETHLVPFAFYNYGIGGEGYHFMQDNAACHRSHETMSWLSAMGIPLLSWPALSPDLNPIENLWGWMVRRIYLDARQFSNVAELKKCIINTWNSIEVSLLQNLIDSMHERMCTVVANKVACTKW